MPVNTSILPSHAASGRGTTARVLGIVAFNFAAYFCVGLPLAVVPHQVHVVLGYGTVLAGLAVSLQYVATLATRATAGRICDQRGPRISVLYGLAACAGSGALLLAAALASAHPPVSLGLLLASRLLLGTGESLVTTATIMWGIGALGSPHTGKVISWNGVTTYAALAAAAPVGVWLGDAAGFASLGVATLLLALPVWGLAWRREGVRPIAGRRIPARQVLARMLPFGSCLGLASIGFGAITAFIALYYGDRGWGGPALAITLLGVAFVATRLLLPNAIARFGGFQVAVASLAVEALGLLTIWLAPAAGWAALGAAVTGCGFALVFPALGIEAVRRVSDSNRGTALGIYSLFLDLALAITGPLAGWLAHRAGFGAIYLLAGLAAASAALASLALARTRGARAPVQA
jgi:MFS family permease